jgi:uncharacterized protein YqgC (DUF456 family)
MSIIEIFFLAILGFSLISNFLSIPGNFIIFLNTVWYGIATDFHEFSFSFLITLFIVAVSVELLEYFIIAFGARKYGASRWGVVGAIVGGIGGGISGFFFSPVFGALVGGFLGVIAGTLSIELFKGKNIKQAGYAALGATLGRVGGLTIKAVGTVTMVFIVANKLFF